MIINIAVAITGNCGIGLKGQLPWPYLKGDMALFSKRTIGSGNNAVIMGRKTWNSIPENRRPLKNRKNMIISHNELGLQYNSCHLFSSTYDAITFCDKYGKYDEVWIIGGSGIYNEFLNTHYEKINRIYITYVCDNYECDTFINIPTESYFIEEKVYNSTENCYYLTCLHKMRLSERIGMELLEDFIKECDSNNLHIYS